MASSKPAKRDLPGIAEVLHAIEEDAETSRETKASQMQLFRQVVQKKYPRGLPEDELEHTAGRLRGKLMRIYKSNAIVHRETTMKGRTKDVKFVKPPFERLFYSGMRLLKKEYLGSLGVAETSEDEEDCSGPPDSGSAHTSARVEPIVASSQRNDKVVNDNAIGLRKRKPEEIATEAGPEDTDAQQSKRVKMGHGLKPAPNAIAVPIDNLSTPGGQETQHAQAEGEGQTEQRPGAHSGLEHDQRLIVPHQDWIQDQMNSIESAIWSATLARFQELGTAEMAASRFVKTPEHDLEALYQLLFGQDSQFRICDVQAEGPPLLKQVYVVEALFGAAIHKLVLAQDSDWDLRRQMQNPLDHNHKYFVATMTRVGQDADVILKNMACRKASDTAFQETEVVLNARKLAGSTALTLQPHLQQLVKRTAPGGHMQYKRWYQYLEKAFKVAITLKQVIMSSDLGIFEIKWPNSGEPFDAEHHRLRFDLDSTARGNSSKRVLHTVLPIIWKSAEDNMLAYHRGLVVPVANKEAPESSS